MSMVRVAFAFARLRSSSVSATYWPFSYSYALMILSQVTSFPVLLLMRLYPIGEKSRLSTIVRLRSCVLSAVNICTGMYTRPKLIAPFHNALCAMVVTPLPDVLDKKQKTKTHADYLVRRLLTG